MTWQLALLAVLVLWIPACLVARIVLARRHRGKSRPAAKLPAEGGKLADKTLRVLQFAHDTHGRPVYWDTRRQPHLAIAGVTGNGKTATTRTIIRSAIVGRWAIWIADPKLFELRSFRGHPGVQGIADDGPSITKMMHAVFDELHDRARILADLIDSGLSNDEALEKAGFQPMLVVVDEVSEMVQMTGGKKSTAVDDLTTVARMGRSLDIHLLPATQQFNASESLPTSVRAQCDARLAVGRIGPNGCRILEWSKEQDIVPPGSDPGVASFVKASGAPARLIRVDYADAPRAIVSHPPGKVAKTAPPSRAKRGEDVRPSRPAPRPSTGLFRSGRLPAPADQEVVP